MSHVEGVEASVEGVEGVEVSRVSRVSRPVLSRPCLGVQPSSINTSLPFDFQLVKSPKKQIRTCTLEVMGMVSGPVEAAEHPELTRATPVGKN